MAVVATWHEFAYDVPELAAVAALLWPGITALDHGLPRPAGHAMLFDRIPGHDAARRKPETASVLLGPGRRQALCVPKILSTSCDQAS